MPEDILNVVNATQEPAVEVQSTETTEQAQPVETKPAEAVAPQQDKPVQSAEENAKYAAARRKAESEKAEAVQRAKDEAYAELAKELDWKLDGKPVSNRDEFQRLKMVSDLQAKGIDPTVVQDIIKNDPTVKKANEFMAKQQADEKTKADHIAFFEAFKEETGKDYSPSDIDTYTAVRQKAEASGKSLKDAYVAFRNVQIKAENAELKAKLQAQETNKANAESTPGSVKTEGAQTAGVVTEAEIDAHASDMKWMNKHYKEVEKFYSKKKG